MMLDIRFEKRELAFPVALAVVVVLLTTLPVFYGHLRSDANSRFVGFLAEPYDHNTYFSWMKQAKDGNIFFEEKYSGEEQPRNIFLLYFLITGLLSRVSGVPLDVAYQAMRMFSAFILLVTAYFFISYFLKTRPARRITFLLICFSAGLGGYFSFLHYFFKFRLPPGWSSLDQNMPELVTFWTVSWFGQASLGIAIMLFTFLCMLYSIEKNKISFSFLSGLMCIAISLLHPYHVITIFFVMGAYILFLLFKRDSWAVAGLRNYLILILTALPALGYQYYATQANPILKAWSKITYPPFAAPIGYLFGLGIIAALALFSLPQVIGSGDKRIYFPAVWCAAISVFIYQPFIFPQRHAAYGAHIAFCVLAGIGFLRLCEKLRYCKDAILSVKGKALFLVLLILASPTNMAHMAADFRNAHRRQYPYFLPGELMAALAWMDKELPREDIVLAPKDIANLIPPYSGLKVYFGHFAETKDYHRKLEIYNEFMRRDTSDGYRKNVLKEGGISYIVFNKEDAGTAVFGADKKPWLSGIFENNAVAIYKVRLP